MERSDLGKVMRSVLDYDAQSGTFTWKRSPDMSPQWLGKYAGRPALTSIDDRGYVQGRCRGVKVYGHRVAWLLHHGEWPAGQVDHINGNRADNRIENLRVATPSENARNSGSRGGASRYRGVSFNARAGKWQASVWLNGASNYIGLFPCETSAAVARDVEAKRLHGEFVRLNCSTHSG